MKTYESNAKIIVLPKGKVNPRRKGTARFRRYESLRKSRTVGAFLAKQPKWNATINRCVAERLIRVA